MKGIFKCPECGEEIIFPVKKGYKFKPCCLQNSLADISETIIDEEELL